MIFVRHGQSTWNGAKRFTGWVDVDLTDKGRVQAMEAGELLKRHKIELDEAHSSLLTRATRTMNLVLDVSEQAWISIKSSWRLNERHYGALTGVSKTEAGDTLGADALSMYRQSWDCAPMPMSPSHPFYLDFRHDRRYKGVDVPEGESLKMCYERILPYWEQEVVPSLKAGRTVMVTAHNNVIRCLVKHIDDLPEDGVNEIEIPQGSPLLYILDRRTLKSTREQRGPHSMSGVFLKDLGGVEDEDQLHHEASRSIYYAAARPLPIQRVLAIDEPSDAPPLCRCYNNQSQSAGTHDRRERHAQATDS